MVPPRVPFAGATWSAGKFSASISISAYFQGNDWRLSALLLPSLTSKLSLTAIQAPAVTIRQWKFRFSCFLCGLEKVSRPCISLTRFFDRFWTDSKAERMFCASIHARTWSCSSIIIINRVFYYRRLKSVKRSSEITFHVGKAEFLKKIDVVEKCNL